MLDISYLNVDSTQIAYKIIGNGKIDLVVEMGLGSCIGEWLHIADRLSTTHTVLLYERAGIGSSSMSQSPRTPYNIAMELFSLLSQLEHEEQIILLAHSQGGLYAQQFVRLYPNLVKKLILLDPLSANDNSFKTRLTKKEYKMGGIDKTFGLKLQLFFARLHLGFIIKSVMKQAPPFYYYKDFSEEVTKYILSALTKPSLSKTALNEYNLAHDETNINQLNEATTFPQIPIYLLTHSSAKEIQEIIQFGNAPAEIAEKVENVWQSIMKEYLTFSKENYFFSAENSTHYIHLTDTDLVCKVVDM